MAGLAGCNSTPPEGCAPEPQELLDSEGHVYRCIASEDCPRTSRLTLCVSDTDVLDECIRCLETKCVRVFPEVC
ncbi:hypothetical protein F0U61_03645 [Archangium violaceum]|nr:hypothetical protein F0U61_03645 [Archangium violaceum]